MTLRFCDFCPCEGCRDGEDHISHAQTSDGRWICDVCYLYDNCVDAQRKAGTYPRGPCEDRNCEHRPTIASDWFDYEENWRAMQKGFS